MSTLTTLLRVFVVLVILSVPAYAKAPSWYDEDLVNTARFHISYIADKKIQQTILRTIKFNDLIIRALRQEGMEPTVDEISEVLSQIAHESSGFQNVIGLRGEVGLMQLMPSTAKFVGVNPHTPYNNILGGVRYRKYLKTFGFCGDDLLVAYNAGPAKVGKCGQCKSYIRSINSWAKIFKNILINQKA